MVESRQFFSANIFRVSDSAASEDERGHEEEDRGAGEGCTGCETEEDRPVDGANGEDNSAALYADGSTLETFQLVFQHLSTRQQHLIRKLLAGSHFWRISRAAFFHCSAISNSSFSMGFSARFAAEVGENSLL